MPKTGLMHPRYVKAFSQNHASWIFGGLAELIDNARDACAQRYVYMYSLFKLSGTMSSCILIMPLDGLMMDHLVHTQFMLAGLI